MVGQMNDARASKLRALHELLGYGAASAIALAVDVSILKTLVEVAGWHYLTASVVAFICGGLVAYALSVRFVFRQHRVHRRSLELTCFLALGTAGVAVNALVLSLAISVAGLGLVTAKICAAGCTFATNFALRRNLLFATNAAARP
jgi:putative flippase GtrA